MALTDEEFSAQFYAASSLLQKVQLAIRENRYTIWARSNPPNFPDEYLGPILDLPPSTPVIKKERRSGGAGQSYVLELRYLYREMGRPIRVYLKGFFSHTSGGKIVIELMIQSLKENTEQP